jgi:type VI secretion system protein ImpE
VKAEELIKAGRLDEALADLNQAVRAKPDDGRLRVFLFQLNCVLGRWDKALTQLGVLADLGVETKLLAQIFRPVIQCEALRAEVFAGKRTPIIFGEPLEWVGYLAQANALAAQGKFQAAADLRDRAFEAAPASAGNVDGKPFAWFADADTRLGPVLELILDGKYYWVPFCRIQRIVIEPPTDLRDLVFLPVQIVWSNGGEATAHIPTRYAGTEKSNDGALALARRTDWSEPAEGFAFGLGQRVFATDEGEFPLLECKCIQFTPTA